MSVQTLAGAILLVWVAMLLVALLDGMKEAANPYARSWINEPGFRLVGFFREIACLVLLVWVVFFNA